MKINKNMILSWVTVVVVFYFTAAIAIRLVIPIVMNRIFGLEYPPNNGFGRAIIYGMAGLIVFLCYLLLNKTGVGLKYVNWFKNVNKEIIDNIKNK